jgi:integrase
MASYTKHPNGSWSVRFRTVENFEVIQKRISGFKTKREAENAYLEYKQQSDEEKNNKISNEASKLTFDKLYKEYCIYQKSRIKESSYNILITKTKNLLLPYFEKYLVVAISPRIILQWQNTLENYSFRYKQSLRIYLHGILKYAEKYYRIPNQIRYVDGFRKNEARKEMQIWNEDEFVKFISHCERLEYKAFFSALYLTGARKGEILATKWLDWDFDKKILNIDKNVTRHIIGQRYLLTTPKNESSYRKILIPDNLYNIMLEYKNSLKTYNENDFVFGGKEPLPCSTIDSYYKYRCIYAGVKKIRLHDFRHSHASYLISKGASIVAVAKRLGHKNIEQTLNTYSHLLQNDESELVNKLESIKI